MFICSKYSVNLTTMNATDNHNVPRIRANKTRKNDNMIENEQIEDSKSKSNT